MIKDLALHAAQLLDVLGEVAGQEFLTARWVGEAGVGQGLAVRAEGLPFGAREAINVF